MLKPKHSLATKIKESRIISVIADKIKALPDYKSYKGEKELLVYILQLINYELDPKKYPTIDKAGLMLQIFQVVFEVQLTDQEEQTLSDDILFIMENNLIKEVSILSKSFYRIGEMFKKKPK